MEWPVYNVSILSPCGNKHELRLCFPVFTEMIDGQEYTWFARRDGQLGGLCQRHTEATSSYVSAEDLRMILAGREAEPHAEELGRSILNIRVDHTPRVLQRLETLFLRAIYDYACSTDYDTQSPVTLTTAAHQAAEWLFGFYRQTRLRTTSPPTGFSPPVRNCVYNIRASEFGETLHIFACHKLLHDYHAPSKNYEHKPQLGWKLIPDSKDANERFRRLLGGSQSLESNDVDTDTRNDINRYLLAPMLVKDPLGRHATILQGLLSDRYEAIGTAVDDEVKLQLHELLKRSERQPAQWVGIWIRASTSNETTNTTAERWKQILDSVPPDDGIVLLGDHDRQPADRRSQELHATITTARRTRKMIDLRGLSDADWLRNAQGGEAVVLYQSQASVLVRLYRKYGLYCVIGNKSGGMDLAAFASIPSIQISPDAVTKAPPRLYQRLVFTSLCSPFWRIIDGSNGTVHQKELDNAIAAARDTKRRHKRPPQ